MKRSWIFLILMVCSLLMAGDKAEITLVQLNDVYELNPLNSRTGTEGGLAKVATIIKQLRGENAHTYALIAGDFLSPSALGLAEVAKPGGGSERLDGRQMVDVFNIMGLDYATFGNHEFDLSESALLARMNESKFTWLASNILKPNDEPWPGALTYKIIPIAEGDKKVRIGIFALTLDSNRPDYVKFNNDYLSVARDMASALRALGAEIVIGLTHLTLNDDINIATHVEGLDMVMGGHEHENVQVWRGPQPVPVFKADADARTVYIHRLSFDWTTRKLAIHSDLKKVDEHIPDDPETKTAVDHWTKLAFDAFRASGIDPEQKIAIAKTNLDGRESVVRNGETVLTRIIADSMKGRAQASIYNAGSIRIDDEIRDGQVITMYDVLRILPFGGQIVRTEIKGALLIKALDQGLGYRGRGGFLQRSGVGGYSGAWTLNEAVIDPNATYTVCFNDFLLQGKEDGLGFLKVLEPVENGGVKSLVVKNTDELKVLDKSEAWLDMRKALADELRKVCTPIREK